MAGWGAMSSTIDATATTIDATATTLCGSQVEVELVGPHLRVGGKISLGHFGRISDRVNNSRGFVLVHDARLLKRNGDPTPLVARSCTSTRTTSRSSRSRTPASKTGRPQAPMASAR